MHHIANQGLLNKVSINYSNLPLAVYVLGTQDLNVDTLVDYLNLDKIQVVIERNLIAKYTRSTNNINHRILEKIDYLFTNSIVNNYSLAIIGVHDFTQLDKQLEQLHDAYYFTIVYFVDSEQQLSLDIAAYKNVLSSCHELHYLRLAIDGKFELIFSKYGANICYYQNTLDNRTLELARLINAR